MPASSRFYSHTCRGVCKRLTNHRIPVTRASVPKPVASAHMGNDANKAKHPRSPSHDTTGQTMRCSLRSCNASKWTMLYHTRVKTFASSSREESDGRQNDAADYCERDGALRVLDLRGHDGHAHEPIPAPEEDRGACQYTADAASPKRHQIRRIHRGHSKANEYAKQSDLGEKQVDRELRVELESEIIEPRDQQHS